MGQNNPGAGFNDQVLILSQRESPALDDHFDRLRPQARWSFGLGITNSARLD